MAHIVLIRHAQVLVDPTQPADRWRLSDEGRKTARALVRYPGIASVTRFFSSPEPKAVETARAAAAGRPVEEVELLKELERSGAGWVGDETAYVGMVEEILCHPEHPVHGCESGVQAQRRITLAVNGLRAAYPDEIVAIVSGGIALTLYLAAIQDLPTADPATWREIRMPDVAIVNPASGQVVQAFGAYLIA